MNFMRAFLIFLILLLTTSISFAYELILPREKKTITDNQYAFFVGKAKRTEEISINDERIYIAPNGAFAHSVKLKEGENRIFIHSNFNRNVYKVYKNRKVEQHKPELKEFDKVKFKVIDDNTPMRSTPIDFGMNRISHLFKDTNLIIDGEQGDFYRVFLAKNHHAWVMKTSVVRNDDKSVAKFITMNSKTYKNASEHIIEFSDKLPYTIEEHGKEIVFKVYNPEAAEDSIYTVNIIKPEKYVYKTNLINGIYNFKVNSLPLPDEKTLDGLTIVVDAGHGGGEKGAVGCLGDCEKDINLKIADELQNILKLMGANVVMTREFDGDVSLGDRIKIADENNADLFISIHLDSIPDISMNIHKNRGTTVYYYNKNSRELAQSIEKSVVKALGTKDNGYRTASFAVIRPTNYVSVLVEVAYMTNPLDSLIYKADDFAQNTAKAIADGILNYVNEE